MPKISVHLEADSAEEFRALIAAFVRAPERVVYAPVAAATPDGVEDALADYHSQASPDVVNGEDLMNERVGPDAQPVAKKAKRGRPFKTAPVEPAPTPAPTTAEAEIPATAVLPEPAPDLEAFRKQGEIDAATPLPQIKSVKAAPKAKEPEIVVSRQDLLDAFSEYVQRYGASFGFSDISSLLQKNLGDGVRKASDVPEDKLPVAIGAIKTAIADNPFNRKRDYA